MKLYVVVRSDMSKSQQAVQAGHALAELLIRKNIGWKNGTLIYLTVPSERKLKNLLKKIPSKNKVSFEEPFWDNSTTAIAAYGRDVADFLKKLPLMSLS